MLTKLRLLRVHQVVFNMHNPIIDRYLTTIVMSMLSTGVGVGFALLLALVGIDPSSGVLLMAGYCIVAVVFTVGSAYREQITKE